MKCNEPGVSDQSNYYFHTPTKLAKSLFYYGLCGGEFFCQRGYYVHRQHYNSFLLLIVLDGTLTLPELSLTLNPHQGYLLNCYEPHTYLTDANAHFLFLHFDGGSTQQFFDHLQQAKGPHAPIAVTLTHIQHLTEIIETLALEGTVNEHLISARIHELLISFVNTTLDYSAPISQALQMMESNYMQPLKMSEVAHIANLSLYHFSRRFRAETGYAPYEYFLHRRIHYAKQFLKTTDASMSSIALSCGFSSESNFSYTFKKTTGMTPTDFRRLPF